MKYKYNTNFKDNEEFYLNDELSTLYIDEILIRAYFYAKMRGQVNKFNDFLDNFLDPSLKTAKDDLKQFLKEEFGISYLSDQQLRITIDPKEQKLLYEKLEKLRDLKSLSIRSHSKNAEKDSQLILTIYKLREKYNESDDLTIFGYKTWWLSKDTTTYKAVSELFGNKYPVSCYIRPEFLYNYISLAPLKSEVDDAYRELFPSLLGINISFHLPNEVTEFVQKEITEHKSKSPQRLKAIIRRLSEKLKSDTSVRTRKYVQHFLDEEIKKIEKGER